jgi:hypothetical protein
MPDVTILLLPSAFPTLCAIDAVREGTKPFATDADAPYLELRARALADEYWSETTWLTGHVSAARFAAVVDRLERERSALRQPVRLVTAADSAPLRAAR